MTKVLLLDVMDTLVRDPFHEAIPGYFGLTLPQLFEQKHPTAWVEFELGQLSLREYCDRMFADGRSVDAERFVEHIRPAYRLLDGVEALLGELSARGVEMHALSNYPELYSVMDREVGLSRFVQPTFVSYRTRVRKPDPEAYLGAARTLGRSPADCIFVDDRVTNTRAAEAVGMPSVVFEGAEALRRSLASHGILG
jgi:HAD superfamily hydrolase (TIGR01509 family)